MKMWLEWQNIRCQKKKIWGKGEENREWIGSKKEDAAASFVARVSKAFL